MSGQVTCGVHTEAVSRVVDSIQEAADAAGVQAKLILSGKGDWRFLDIVAAGAGKLAALECAASRDSPESADFAFCSMLYLSTGCAKGKDVIFLAPLQ